MFIACFLIGCRTAPSDGESGAAADFFLGEWSRSENAGQGVVTHRSWTFKADGTLLESGYPAWEATARYEVVSRSDGSVTLRLSRKGGEQAYALPDELVLVHDPPRDTLTVNGAGPFRKSTVVAEP